MSSNALSSSILAAVTLIVGLSCAQANEVPAQQNINDRLLIVNGNSHRVIYDDGQDDLFCVSRRTVVGYDEDGYAAHRRTIRCR